MRVRPAVEHDEATRRSLHAMQRRVYLATRGGRALTQAMGPLTAEATLRAAWDRVRRSDGVNTPGPDGCTRVGVERRLGTWLSQLGRSLANGAYRPTPPRWVEVPKSQGDSASGTRRLGILTLRDRTVHAALKAVLDPVFDPGFSERSYGFRPGRSVTLAREAVRRRLSCPTSPPICYALRLDVKSCFDTIDHELLRQRVAARVTDAAVLALMERLWGSGADAISRPWWWWRERSRGLVQGGALSPLLCNVSLHPLDEAMRRAAEAMRGRVEGYRYADDLLLLAADRRSLRYGAGQVRAAVRALRQRCGRSKTRRARVERGFEWLGVGFMPREVDRRITGRRSFGYHVPDAGVRRVLDRLAAVTAGGAIDARGGGAGGELPIERLNLWLRQWGEAYRDADNAAEVFRLVDVHAQRAAAALLAAERQGGASKRPGGAPRSVLSDGRLASRVAWVRLTALTPQRRPVAARRNPWERPSPRRTPKTSRTPCTLTPGPL